MTESELAAALAGGGVRGVRAARAAAAIRRSSGYRWVGLYDVGEEEIAVVGWDGPAPPAHSRFPRNRGLCGAAATTGETVVVGDVAEDPRYLTTHATTRSEIVVPVVLGGVVVGLIDVESERLDAFGGRDRELIERYADLVAPLWASGSPRSG